MVDVIASAVVIVECGSADELLRWYPAEFAPQPVYVAVDVRTGRLWADHDPEVGNGVPWEVAYGFERRWPMPLLTGDAANAVLAEIEPLARRVLDGAEAVWDGNNTVVRLDADAAEAEEAIEELLGGIDAEDDPGVLPVWTVESMGQAWTAEEAGITAETTDAELVAVEERLLAEFRAGMEQPDAVIHALDAYLAGLRDELVAAD